MSIYVADGAWHTESYPMSSGYFSPNSLVMLGVGQLFPASTAAGVMATPIVGVYQGALCTGSTSYAMAQVQVPNGNDHTIYCDTVAGTFTTAMPGNAYTVGATGTYAPGLVINSAATAPAALTAVRYGSATAGWFKIKAGLTAFSS